MDRKRPGKPLLLATLGLATLSYVSLQGCADDSDGSDDRGPPVDGGLDGSREGGQILIDSGNLLPPPPQDAAADSAARDADVDAQLPPVSGNLLPPPDSGS
jgi:hypothetical protein